MNDELRISTILLAAFAVAMFLEWLYRQPIGTKSLLFGYHQFLIHPIVLFLCWWNLFGFPRNPRLWVAFAVHDWGYWGKSNMDGPEGETHPLFGALLMGKLFDGKKHVCGTCLQFGSNSCWDDMPWASFTLRHSRFLAKKMNRPISRLCIADKLSIVATPWWVFAAMTYFSGELAEYRLGQNGRTNGAGKTVKQWHGEMQDYLRKWIPEETKRAR